MMQYLGKRSAAGILLALCAQFISGCATKTAPVQIAGDVVASSSSYECRQTPVDGLPTAGDGAYGCHFQLLDAETKGILGNTPYSLDIYAPAKTKDAERLPLATLKGVTDAHGRSGFIRAPFPIHPEDVRFVRMFGTGPYGRSPRLVRATDGLGSAGINYYVKGCGYDHKGLTDEQGFSALFLAETECKLEGAFYSCRDGKCATN